jgi:signal transduction histidine kinase
VTDYLDISLLFSGNMLPKEGVFSPRLLLEDINNSFRQASEARQLSLSVQLPPPESGLLIKSDQALLYKVLSQLVDNAVKFTRQGSVSMGYEKSGGELEFFVRDTGEGIAEASFARIFDSFMMEDNSATRSHEGSGLGLTIAKNITEMLGGRIRFESVKGKGSVFYVSIPVGRMS